MSDNKRETVDGAKVREEAVARGDALREKAVAYAAGVMGALQPAAPPTPSEAPAAQPSPPATVATAPEEPVAATTETAGV